MHGDHPLYAIHRKFHSLQFKQNTTAAVEIAQLERGGQEAKLTICATHNHKWRQNGRARDWPLRRPTRAAVNRIEQEEESIIWPLGFSQNALAPASHNGGSDRRDVNNATQAATIVGMITRGPKKTSAQMIGTKPPCQDIIAIKAQLWTQISFLFRINLCFSAPK